MTKTRKTGKKLAAAGRRPTRSTKVGISLSPPHSPAKDTPQSPSRSETQSQSDEIVPIPKPALEDPPLKDNNANAENGNLDLNLI